MLMENVESVQSQQALEAATEDLLDKSCLLRESEGTARNQANAKLAEPLAARASSKSTAANSPASQSPLASSTPEVTLPWLRCPLH